MVNSELGRPYQEGLPAYWGIETQMRVTMFGRFTHEIRKDYPLIGVLKLRHKGLLSVSCVYQEGLPAYWGIETCWMKADHYLFLQESGRTTRLLGY